ncbi:MAG: serine hydrolase domain-containing protein [Bacteroidales bacterium]
MRTVIMSLLGIFLFCSCSRSNSVGISAKVPSHEIESLRIQVDSLMSSYDFHGRFSGTVLIAHKDSIWYEDSFGYADFDLERPNTNSSVYGIGSVTKQFTATAILKLVQEGKLSLTDNLSLFFPELGETGNEITIHHLLSMTSGIYEDFSRSKTYDISNVVFPEADPISTHDLVHYFGKITSDSKPGKKFDYSNINYIILAAIIEQISGQNYGEHLKETFWQRLGMESTDFGITQINEENLSKPYIGLPTQFETPEFWHDSWVLGAGGAFSSAQDLYHWMYRVNNVNVLDSSYTNKLFKKNIQNNREHYGYGWQIGSRKGNEYHHHGGGTLGYVCEVGFFPELDIYVVVLTNHSHNLLEIGKSVQVVNEINRQIDNILFGEPYKKLPVPKRSINISLNNNYNVGGYEYTINQNEESFEITAVDDSPSILDIAFLQDLNHNDKSFKKVQKLAEAFGNEDFKYIRKNAELMLKVLVSTKKLAGVWTEITGDKGEFLGYNFYQVPNEKYKSSYKVRLVHENKEIGLLLTFNKRGKMMGMHIDKTFSFGGPKKVQAIPISNDLLFIDGFKHGYPDAYIERVNDQWVVKTVVGEFIMK